MGLPAANEIRDTAQQVLQSSEYKLEQKSNPFEPVMGKLFEALAWLLNRFIEFVDSFEGIPFFLRWFIVVVLILVLCLLVGHIVYTLIAAARPVKIPVGSLDQNQRRVLDPQEFENEAELLAQQGKLIEAIRCLLKASLLRIESAFERPFRNATTNGQFIKKYKKLPILESVQILVEQIDNSWYGELPCEEDDYSRCLTSHRSILSYLKEARNA